MDKRSRSGSGIWDEHPGSYFRDLGKNFWLKILKSFDVDPNPGSGIFLTLDLKSGMEKFGSWKNISDPQHWSQVEIKKGCVSSCTLSSVRIRVKV
jgi:hypothetical protein